MSSMPAPPGSARRWRARSQPSMPGMPMSSTAMSNAFAASELQALPRRCTQRSVRRPCDSSNSRQAVGRIAVVVDDQDRRRRWNVRLKRPRRGAGVTVPQARCFASGSRTVKVGALAQALACGLDAAAVQLDQALDQRQPDAESALRRLGRSAHLHEHVEDRLQHVRRQGPCPCRAPRPRRCRSRCARDSLHLAARRRVLGRVVQQVGEHLREAHGVAAHHERFVGAVRRDSVWPRPLRPAAGSVRSRRSITRIEQHRLACAGRSCRA